MKRQGLIIKNYPNPFNNTTEFDFILPENSYTVISIYDLFGNKIEEAIKDYFPAGNHKIKWNAGNLSSGLYFYEIQSNKQKLAKIMEIVK